MGLSLEVTASQQHRETLNPDTLNLVEGRSGGGRGGEDPVLKLLAENELLKSTLMAYKSLDSGSDAKQAAALTTTVQTQTRNSNPGLWTMCLWAQLPLPQTPPGNTCSYLSLYPEHPESRPATEAAIGASGAAGDAPSRPLRRCARQCGRGVEQEAARQV